MKYGRLPRRYDSRIPHYSSLVAGKKLSPVPTAVDYAQGMPANLGFMENDSIGDCTCAAIGHAIQIWSFNADGSMVTPPDADILAVYEAVGGYVPGDSNTDQGCDEQSVLTYWLTNAVDGNTLAAFVEVDPRNLDDVKRVVWQCGACYIGFNVPTYLESLETPGAVWDVPGNSGIPANADTSYAGGHAVLIVGYTAEGNLIVESWGSIYTMTAAFWAANVDEAYAIVNKAWCEQTGLTPTGDTLAQLETQMDALKEAT